MSPASISTLKSKLAPQSRFGPVSDSSSHRTAHGGAAWVVAAAANIHYQPQDGAPDPRIALRSQITDIASRLRSAFSGEPEDARITGTTRSLSRRVSGLNNVSAIRRAVASVTSANVAPTKMTSNVA